MVFLCLFLRGIKHMNLNEMEKRMLYQTEGSERYAVLQEMSMASRYAGDPARRKAAKSLLEKLRPLTDAECMEAVHDIRRNYRLPQEGRTIDVHNRLWNHG